MKIMLSVVAENFEGLKRGLAAAQEELNKKKPDSNGLIITEDGDELSYDIIDCDDIYCGCRRCTILNKPKDYKP